MKRRPQRIGRLASKILAAVLGLAWLCVPAGPSQAASSKCKYVVKKGDTLSRIARRKGVSEKSLLRANPKLKKNPNRLRVGQSLEICKAKRYQASGPQKCGKSGRIVRHKVGPGETLFAIAAKYSASRASIRKYNKKLAKRTNSMIRRGETLRICTTSSRYTKRGRLKDGVQLAPGDGYQIRRPGNAWGTPAAIESIAAALRQYHGMVPDGPDVGVGDISRKSGGPLGGHLSHQSGRDIDVYFVLRPRDDDPTRKTLDVPRSWELIKAFAEDDNLAVIFADYDVQKKLYEYAKSIGEDPAHLDAMFQYPRKGEHEAVIYHWPGHRLHFHARFKREPPKKPADEEPTS